MNHTPMPPSAGRVFQLTDASVSPTRPAGRDENGIPREETICALAKHERFVDTKGNICVVPLRTSRVLGMTSEDEKYEQIQRKDQILAGSLPLAECPYTTEYARLVNPQRSPDVQNSLVPVKRGEEACNGEPEGCKHLRPIIESRRAKAIAEAERQEEVGKSISVAAAGAMMREFGEGVGSKMSHDSAGTARKNMREGKGET
jgi:hypothetical protein